MEFQNKEFALSSIAQNEIIRVSPSYLSPEAYTLWLTMIRGSKKASRHTLEA